MNIEEKIQLIEEGTLEVIDTEELKEVLKKEMNADAGKVLKSPKKDRNFAKKNENNGE